MDYRKGSFIDSLKSLDIFGESVKLTIKKKPTYQTWMGAFLSVLTMALFLAFCAVRTIKLASREDPFFSMMTMEKDESIPIDLWANNFVFAVEAIDPRIGRLVVEHYSWADDKIKTDIQMTECKDFIKDPSFDKFSLSKKQLI